MKGSKQRATGETLRALFNASLAGANPCLALKRRIPAPVHGRTVLVASHLMRELQDAADHVIVVGHGRVIADSPVAGLVGRWGSLEAAYLSLTSGAVDYRGQA